MKDRKQALLNLSAGIAMLIAGLWTGSFAWLAQLLGFIGIANGAQLLAEREKAFKSVFYSALSAVFVAVALKLAGMAAASAAVLSQWNLPILILLYALVLTALCGAMFMWAYAAFGGWLGVLFGSACFRLSQGFPIGSAVSWMVSAAGAAALILLSVYYRRTINLEESE